VPFRTGPDQPRDLKLLIDGEVRARIEDAVDYVSLDVLVQRRRARGLPPPSADNGRDRDEFTAGVRAFLERLLAELLPQADPDIRRRTEETAATGDDAVTRLVAAQVTLARALPDYWQRFEAIRTAFTSERLASRGEGRSRLGWLLGR
jgi:hypothetical protein